ncbi:MAG: hypothetical protein NTU62_07100, partial [Spirochaetes bacterium]|nr:hypothetical protein [Spirochaetota bacterium]
PASVAADTAVGTISSLSGTVQIDAFGKGAFIAAMRGDRIYDTTVIRTGPRSGATIELLGKLSQIPPDTTFRIVDAMEGQRRTNRLGWFPALLGVVRDAVASFGASGSDVVLGSKAAEATADDEEWIVEEDDPQEQLIDARKAVREGDWLHALNILDAIPENAADALLPGEVSFLRGSACFGLGDYAAARMHLAKAEPIIRGSAEPEAAEILPVLLFQLGASRFFVGEDGPAVAALTSFVALDADSPFAPYAYQLLLQALMAQGERTRAQQVLAQAKVRFVGTVHEREFMSLPPAP